MLDKEPRKPRKNRRAYLNNYQLGANGRYEYRGKSYYWDEEDARRKKLLYLFFGMGSFSILLGILIGSIRIPGMDDWFVLILFYVAELAALIFQYLAIWRMFYEKNPMREHIYEKSVKTLPGRTAIVIIIAVIMLISENVHLVRNGAKELITGVILFFVFQIAIIVMSVYMHRTIQKIHFTVK